MIQLKKILQERISDTVYHITSTFRLHNILKTNKFILTSNLTSREYPMSYGKFYYLSTARTPQNLYFYTNVNNYGTAILVLDGNKLNNNYKGKSVSYYNSGDSTTRVNKFSTFESEDRILTNNSEIPNAKLYIKEIHIYCLNYYDVLTLKYIKEIIKMSNTISVYLYNNIHNFLLLNKNKSIDISNIIKSYKDAIKTQKINNIYKKDKTDKKINTNVISLFNLCIDNYKNKSYMNIIDIRDIEKMIVRNILRIHDKKELFNNILNRILIYLTVLTKKDTFDFSELLRKNKLTMKEYIWKLINNVAKNNTIQLEVH